MQLGPRMGAMSIAEPEKLQFFLAVLTSSRP